jgi:DNA-binding NarL/FixJ family response regulator
VAPLTERERKVLVEVAHGRSNSEIASRLYLSDATIRTHGGHILAKLGLRDRVQVVVLAYDIGLVEPRPRH